MAHIHLCWELGGGLGHAGRLKMLAQALMERGHQVSLSLRDLMSTNALLADLDAPCLQAPVWLHAASGLPLSANLAEVLFHCGYLEADALRGMVAGWRALFDLLKPDLVVGDFAPTALLAARSMGLRSASVGNGYSSPPPGQPLPAFRAAPAARLASSEARMLATANAMLGAAPPYAHAADVFAGDLPLLCTWPELDHYQRPAQGTDWLGPSFVAGGGVAPCWPELPGPKVYAYLKAAHPGHGALLKALVEEGCVVLAYLPEVAAGALPPVLSERIVYAEAPIDLSLALPQARLCVCHAGEGTLAQALLAGVPLLMLPTHNEQFLTARSVATYGAGYNAAALGADADWRAVVKQVLSHTGYAPAAQAFAGRYRDFKQPLMNQLLARRLETLLA